MSLEAEKHILFIVWLLEAEKPRKLFPCFCVRHSKQKNSQSKDPCSSVTRSRKAVSQVSLVCVTRRRKTHTIYPRCVRHSMQKDSHTSYSMNEFLRKGTSQRKSQSFAVDGSNKRSKTDFQSKDVPAKKSHRENLAANHARSGPKALVVSVISATEPMTGQREV